VANAFGTRFIKESTMSDLSTRFQTAVTESKQLPSRPDNDTLLQLYSLYKQATMGDVSGKRPGRFSPIDRAKYDAWAKGAGMSTDEAMQQYIDLVNNLQSG
jgi:diazepam-binding inhibitor (GABA receptor modulating acyl-CoA-binding protein)